MWHNITLGKFQQLTDIVQGQNFDHEIERSVKLLACLFDRPEAEYEAMPLRDLVAETEKLSFLFNEQVPVTDPPKRITVNGRMYKPLYEFTDVTAGQFIDCMGATKDREELVYKMHLVLASLCVPCRGNWLGRWTPGSYGDVPFHQVADDMLQVPIITANSISLFFWTVWIGFLKATPGFSEKMMKKATKVAGLSPNDGDGSQAPTQ